MNESHDKESWVILLHDCFPGVQTLDTPKDVARWEWIIKKLVGSELAEGETSAAILSAAGSVILRRAPTPQDIASWIRTRRALKREEQNQKRALQMDDLRPQDRDTLAKIIHEWREAHMEGEE